MNVCIHQNKVRTIRNTERNEVSSAERSVHKSKVSDELRPFPLGYAGGRCSGVGKLEEPVYCSGDAGSDTVKTRTHEVANTYRHKPCILSTCQFCTTSLFCSDNTAPLVGFPLLSHWWRCTTRWKCSTSPVRTPLRGRNERRDVKERAHGLVKRISCNNVRTLDTH